MTTILQISDTHIVAPGQLVSGRLDTAQALSQLVARLCAGLGGYGPLDAILISGDLSDDGTPDSYAHFKSLMTPLLEQANAPLYVIPGNHDRRAPMQQAFADHAYLPQAGKMNWTKDVGDITLIGLDSLVEGEGGGVLDAKALAFLSNALDKTTKPAMIAVHHPPFPSGIPFMDAIGLAGIPELAERLKSAPPETLVVCGHIHNMMMASVGGRTALAAPSPCSLFAFDQRPDSPKGFMVQEDGAVLHRWRNGFQSIRIPTHPGEGPFPF